MNNNIICLSVLNGICITIVYHLINRNFFSNNEYDKKKYNKQLLLICLLCIGGTYSTFYIQENKLLNNIIKSNDIEIKGGEPNF